MFAFGMLMIYAVIGHGQDVQPLFLGGVTLIVRGVVLRHFRKLEARYIAEEADYQRARAAIERGESR